MSKVKGRYVATVILDIEYDETEKDILPFEDARRSICDGELTQLLRECLDEEFDFGDYATITVGQQYADLYRVDEDLYKV